MLNWGLVDLVVENWSKMALKRVLSMIVPFWAG